jgi:hypothetical protein
VRTADMIERRDARFWHKADIPPALTNVRYRGVKLGSTAPRTMTLRCLIRRPNSKRVAQQLRFPSLMDMDDEMRSRVSVNQLMLRR